jgi:hypothetical protein
VPKTYSCSPWAQSREKEKVKRKQLGEQEGKGDRCYRKKTKKSRINAIFWLTFYRRSSSNKKGKRINPKPLKF